MTSKHKLQLLSVMLQREANEAVVWAMKITRQASRIEQLATILSEDEAQQLLARCEADGLIVHEDGRMLLNKSAAPPLMMSKGGVS